VKFNAINEDETYKIRTVGGYTFGTVTAKNDEDETVTYRSDHPEADSDHWARADQVVVKVGDGTYLGDDGKVVIGR
jgi:hypothetical protein